MAYKLPAALILGSTPIGPPLMVKNMITASMHPDNLCCACVGWVDLLFRSPLSGSAPDDAIDVDNVDSSAIMELAKDLDEICFFVVPSVSYLSSWPSASSSPPDPDVLGE